jgi:hypothetical protein
MGRSTSWAVGPFLCATVLAQTPAPAVPRDASLRPLRAILPEVVIAGGGDGVRVGEFGLGDGGVAAKRGELQFTDDGCTTAGGVRVVCRSAGVKLTFASGREVLIAPDGYVHLRGGESGGPFPGGVEVLLADGQSVRVRLDPSVAERVRDVVVGDGERRLRLRERGEAAREVVRDSIWTGVRVIAAGDGGELYRAIALGPLVVLDRLLVAKERESVTPEQRLAVFAAPLAQSLRTMERQHREPDAAVRGAMKVIAELAEHTDDLFPVGAQLQRVEREHMRWSLCGGFELELTLTGPQAPRLQLYPGKTQMPMVEWTLRADGAAFLVNPRDEQVEKRWHGNGTRLVKVAPDLQARTDLFEFGYAMRVIERLQH